MKHSAILYLGVKSIENQIDGRLADGRRESAPAGRESAIGKGDSNAMDDCCDTYNILTAGAGDRLYHGFVYSHSLCNGCCPGIGQHQSGGYDRSRAETHAAQS